MKKRKDLIAVFLVIASLLLCVGCNEKDEEPITVTLWHVYGAQTRFALERFNWGI